MSTNYFYIFLILIISSCATNPHKKNHLPTKSNLKSYKGANNTIDNVVLPDIKVNPDGSEDLYSKQVSTFKDVISKMEDNAVNNGLVSKWIGTVNYSLRKPNMVIIHHTAQDSVQQTIKTFTLSRTQVSAHYVIGKDGEIIQMLNDYLRAWHAGTSSWGRDFDINSTSIGIELDNNGNEVFTDVQLKSLLALLSKLKTDYNIPAENFVGHSDVAPGRKKDPSAFFPWKTLAENGFGIWYDDATVVAPSDFSPELGLRIIGYNTKNLSAAIMAFKLHFMPKETGDVLDQNTINTIYAVYKKL